MALTKQDTIAFVSQFNNPVVGFYSGKDNNFYAEFSNFYIHQEAYPFIVPPECGAMSGQIVYIKFSEAAIMLCKASLMGDETRFDLIKNATNPMEAKKLGRQVTPFNIDLWNSNLLDIFIL